MIEFAIAITSASLLGSLHCVGMCGPFALWSTGGNRSPMIVASYHAGRLATYLSAGLVAGLIGSAVTISGELAGWQSLAAKVAGAMLVVAGFAGIVRRSDYWQQRRLRRRGPTSVASTPKVIQWLQAAKPIIASQGPAEKAFLGGLMTTWLPCGWLYLFVLVAGGTGAIASSLIVMLAFWIGTLPALTGLIYGARSLAIRFRSMLPTATSLLLIATGCYTATGRAAANLSNWHPNAELKAIATTPLPCCSGANAMTQESTP